MKDQTKDSTPLKTTPASDIHLLACCRDSGNVRMYPSQTGCFALHMTEQLLSSKNSTWINVPLPQARCTCSTCHHANGIELLNITPFRKVKVKIKNSFLICVSQLDASCWTDLIKGFLTILSIAILLIGVKFGSIHSPPLFSVSMPLCWGCQVISLWLLSTPVLVVVIDSGAMRVWSHPSTGGEGPSSYGWECYASGRLTYAHPSSWHWGVLTHYTPQVWSC